MTIDLGPVQTSGFTLDDWRRFREANPEVRIELSEGSLIVMTPPKLNHGRVVTRLVNWFVRHGYDEDIVIVNGGLVVGRNGRIPDLLILCDEIDGSLYDVEAGDVRLVIEVESESTKAADRYIKPDEYAEAGVSHYWRVSEGAPQTAWVNCYVLRDGAYELYLHSSLTALLDSEPTFAGF
jgi:Uma2 family endonuclease